MSEVGVHRRAAGGEGAPGGGPGPGRSARRLSRGSRRFLLVALLGVVVVAGSALALLGAGGGDGEPVEVDIPPGADAARVAAVLADHDVVATAWGFRLLARFDDRSTEIGEGSYRLRTGMGPGEALEALADGPAEPATYRVTLPEGLTVTQSLERIAEAGPLGVEQLEQAAGEVRRPGWAPDAADLPDGAEPLEGLVFPETFDFRAEADAVQVLQRFVDHGEQVVAEVLAEAGRPAEDAWEVVVLASLVEREVRVADERPLVASVITNRLAAGQRLQVDATVLYALGEHRGRLTWEELEVDSPWNTYRHAGLPPTPIAGPGRAALQAAADPPETSYRYYVVADPETGEHVFSETFDEHRRHAEAYRGRVDRDGVLQP